MDELMIQTTGRRETVVIEFSLVGAPDVQALGQREVTFSPIKGKATYVDSCLAYIQISGPLRRKGDRSLSYGPPVDNNYTHREIMRIALSGGSPTMPAWLPDVARALRAQGAPVPPDRVPA